MSTICLYPQSGYYQRNSSHQVLVSKIRCLSPGWPEIELKCSPYFPRVAQKVATAVSTWKGMSFKVAENSPDIWANFESKYVTFQNSPSLVTLLITAENPLDNRKSMFHCTKSRRLGLPSQHCIKNRCLSLSLSLFPPLSLLNNKADKKQYLLYLLTEKLVCLGFGPLEWRHFNQGHFNFRDQRE